MPDFISCDQRRFSSILLNIIQIAYQNAPLGTISGVSFRFNSEKNVLSGCLKYFAKWRVLENENAPPHMNTLWCLDVCRRIADQMSGTIKFECPPNQEISKLLFEVHATAGDGSNYENCYVPKPPKINFIPSNPSQAQYILIADSDGESKDQLLEILKSLKIKK